MISPVSTAINGFQGITATSDDVMTMRLIFELLLAENKIPVVPLTAGWIRCVSNLSLEIPLTIGDAIWMIESTPFTASSNAPSTRRSGTKTKVSREPGLRAFIDGVQG